jgi:RNA polymerase sigma factor (sigma-70 family)
VEPAAAEADRRRAAVDLLAGHGAALWRIARRISICADDADDAVQRAALILLTKSPPLEPGRLAAWMTVVTKREAIAVRRSRERLLSAFATSGEWPGDQLDGLPCDSPGPDERAERSARVAEARRALSRLKPQERVAIILQARGYSYAEICALCGWSYTKVNRCLAEGRAALRARGPAAAADR